MGNITKLGIGTIGLNGTYGKVNLTEYAFAIRYALNEGISLVDTASSYGDAEKLLGMILKDYPHVKISSRLEYSKLINQSNVKDEIKKSCEASLKKLLRESIDFYYVDNTHLDMPLDEMIEGLELLKKEGKIQQYGIGNMGRSAMKQLMLQGNPESILFEYSAIQRQNAEQIFEICQEKNIIKVAYGIVGRGYLGNGLRDMTCLEEGDIRRELELFNHAHTTRNEEVFNAMRAIAKQKGLQVAQVAIAWVLSDPRLDYGVMSTSKYFHVIENIRGAQVELSEEELEYLDTATFYAEKKLMENELGRVEDILVKVIKSPQEGRIQLLDVIKIVMSRQLVEEERLLEILFDLKQFDGEKHTVNALNYMREELKELIQINYVS